MAVIFNAVHKAGGNTSTVQITRFVIVTVFFLIYLSRKKISLKIGLKKTLALIFLGLILYSNVVLFYFMAMKYISPSIGSLILYTYPAMVMILSFFILGEKITGKTIIALLLSLAGCIVVLYGPAEKINIKGIILAALTAFCYAAYIVGSKKAITNIDPAVNIFYTGASCLFFFIVFGAISGDLHFEYNVNIIVLILLLAVWSTIIGFIFFFKGLVIVGASKTSIIATFEPLYTILLSAAVLGDKITLIQLAGGALILAGVLVLNIPKKNKTPAYTAV
jgi:drug/metabolite transporter (DMT)-like permease